VAVTGTYRCCTEKKPLNTLPGNGGLFDTAHSTHYHLTCQRHHIPCQTSALLMRFGGLGICSHLCPSNSLGMLFMSTFILNISGKGGKSAQLTWPTISRKRDTTQHGWACYRFDTYLTQTVMLSMGIVWHMMSNGLCRKDLLFLLVYIIVGVENSSCQGVSQRVRAFSIQINAMSLTV